MKLSPETLVFAAIIAAALLVLLHPRGRRHRQSWFYRWYMHSWIWRTRRWLWYWTSDRHCEQCGDFMVLHKRGLRWRLGAPVVTVHHKNYRHLGFERRTDVMLLCWPCHFKKDSWRHAH